MRKRRIIIIVFFAILLIIGGGFASMFLTAENPDNVVINEVDLKNVADGTYEGSYSLAPIDITLKVTIKDHKYDAIEILEDSSFKKGTADSVCKNVVEKQTLLVDAVSGATASSKAALKAIEEALLGK